MKVIVVTGGIGSGKSAVCRYLCSKGIPVYDSDERCKGLYERYPELKTLIVPDIFSRPEDLKRLEDAVYPLLMEDFKAWAGAQGAETVAFESAVVLQKEYFEGFGDYVLYVSVDEDLRVKRAVRREMEKRGLWSDDAPKGELYEGFAADIRRRMDLQRDQKGNPRVDFVIENNASTVELEADIDKFLKYINYYGN